MGIISTLVIATKNPAKVERYRNIIAGLDLPIIVLSLADFPEILKPEELGNTAEQNAVSKAVYYTAQTGFPCFSEDEELHADFLPLGNQPGVYVRRIDGINEATDDELLAYWEGLLVQVPKEQRTGRWHFAYCIAFPGGEYKIFSRDREILFHYPASPIRLAGWPLSSVCGANEVSKPHSEWSEEEKNMVDAIVADNLAQMLKELLF